MPRMTGNRYIAKMLEAYGITSIFQVPTAFFGVMAEWNTWTSAGS